MLSEKDSQDLFNLFFGETGSLQLLLEQLRYAQATTAPAEIAKCIEYLSLPHERIHIILRAIKNMFNDLINRSRIKPIDPTIIHSYVEDLKKPGSNFYRPFAPSQKVVYQTRPKMQMFAPKNNAPAKPLAKASAQTPAPAAATANITVSDADLAHMVCKEMPKTEQHEAYSKVVLPTSNNFAPKVHYDPRGQGNYSQIVEVAGQIINYHSTKQEEEVSSTLIRATILAKFNQAKVDNWPFAICFDNANESFVVNFLSALQQACKETPYVSYLHGLKINGIVFKVKDIMGYRDLTRLWKDMNAWNQAMHFVPYQKERTAALSQQRQRAA